MGCLIGHHSDKHLQRSDSAGAADQRVNHWQPTSSVGGSPEHRPEMVGTGPTDHHGDLPQRRRPERADTSQTHLAKVNKLFRAEYQVPTSNRAEEHAEFNTFDEALTWINDRRRENPERLFRLFTSGLVTAKMARILDSIGVTFGHS